MGNRRGVSGYKRAAKKFWRANAQHSGYSHKYYLIKFKVAERLDLN